MACKLRCPKCKKMLKEEGDEMKSSNGEYRVYDNLANSKLDAGSYRLILCLECDRVGTVYDFDPM